MPEPPEREPTRDEPDEPSQRTPQGERAGNVTEARPEHEGRTRISDLPLELFREPEPEAEPELDELREPAEDDAISALDLRAPRAPAIEIDELPVAQLGPRPLRVMCVGGARGGVGKTVLAANLGLYLASIGRRVVLVDADPSGANLHTCLGASPSASLARLRRSLRGDARSSAVPEGALQDTSVRGLQLLHLGLDEPGAVARGERTARLMSSLRELSAEHVIVDLGVGLGRETLDNYLAADLAVFVTLPEPTAIENTYRFLRGLFARQLLSTPKDEEAQAELERRVRAHGGAPSPLELYREVEREAPELAVLVQDAMAHCTPHVVVNQTRLRADLHLGSALQSAARRKLGLAIDYVGYIDYDDTVWTCVRNRRPLLLEVPGARSSRKIEKIARRLLMIDSGKAQPAAFVMPSEALHDLLEVERGASDEDVRRAYKRCREIYGHDSLACYGLFEPHEIEQLRGRIDEAFDVLLDPSRRRPYELSVFPDAPAEQEDAPGQGQEQEPPRAAPELSPDTQFTGALLRQVRESQRQTLVEISQRTKISVNYLRAVEEDDFGRLPAAVYTSGFVKELARCLRLDPVQASRTYVARYRRYLDEKERAFSRKA